METYCFKNINFTYPGEKEKALNNISFSVNEGEFLVVCGASGSGKSTLLRQLKEENPEFGFVLQNPSTQIVTDKVYHELAFGMENKGIAPEKMKNAIASTATYFGIDEWMERDTFSLSGGEKQLLNLASALITNPKVILLDEPTAQLDPMAAQTFLDMVKRLNTQLGITVILVEQRLEEVLSICDKMLVLHEGDVVCHDSVQEVYKQICQSEISEDFLLYMPAFVRLYHHFSKKKNNCPRSVKECRRWFLKQDDLPVMGDEFLRNKTQKIGVKSDENEIFCKNVFFRYEKNGKDILKDVSYYISKGKIYGIAGGNGSGKSTFLKVLSGSEKCYHGKVLRDRKIAYLPQEPKYMFINDKIHDIIKDSVTIRMFGLEGLMDRHPYDISGGQMQRLAMAYLWEMNADIYLFDEPTKGLDPLWKKKFREYLNGLKEKGKTILIVTHDVEFAASACDSMSMCFGGNISEPMEIQEFFANNLFYSTAIHRIVREQYPNVVAERFLYED